jgi:putative transposase
MTDVTENQGRPEVELSAADEQVLRELTERARAGGLKLTGEGGLLGKLTKMVIEGALEGELDDHLGYGKHDPEGRDGGNSRNGHRAKTVLTDTGLATAALGGPTRAARGGPAGAAGLGA